MSELTKEQQALLQTYERQNSALDAQLRTMYIDYLTKKLHEATKRQAVIEKVNTEERLRPESLVTLPFEIQQMLGLGRRMCQHDGCGELALPLSDYCPCHGHEDSRQFLYTQCCAVSKKSGRCQRAARCGDPICSVHRALKEGSPRVFLSTFTELQPTRMEEKRPPVDPDALIEAELVPPDPALVIHAPDLCTVPPSVAVVQIKGHMHDIQRERTRLVLKERHELATRTHQAQLYAQAQRQYQQAAR
ncbi:putative DNA-binding domain [Carpediemonas membranifera]|uniref:Putative DNA-binding domain n=1 Tax=Carpediemonas membranifera TaxID=201153 RepID=A0A8J6AXJ7_9EUKA|nr:putative DNA-binding domain [Carpediemonas membranifera]|eukprot:KAG9389734.1 putative DNA-binding domain [Carpediemonas membranifera]